MWFKSTDTQDRWADAMKHLRRDPVMRQIIKQVGPCTLVPRRDYFVKLVQSILSQQVSVAAAASMFRKLSEAMPGKKVTPTNVLTFLTTKDDETIRSVGLSRQKRAYVHDLATKFLDGTIKHRQFAKMDDETLIEHLTQIKGIGRWTVEMLLIFAMNRTDVWPVDDLGIQESYRIQFKLKERPKPKELAPLADKWKPWRTVASWYLWRVRHPAPVAAKSRTASRKTKSKPDAKTKRPV
ncbi:MAG: hypothetical protein QM770_18555 [Tepidisphaeraceae bacterium]